MLVRILSQSHLNLHLRPRPVQLQYSNSNSFQFQIRNLYLHSKSQYPCSCPLLITPSSTPIEKTTKTTTFQNRCFSSSNSNDSNSHNNNQKTALIIGSSGTLGSSIASQLKQYHNCTIIGCDIHPPSKQRLDCIDAFIPLPDVDTLNSLGNGSTDGGGNGTGNGTGGGTEITIDSLIDGLQNGIQNLYGQDTSNVGFDAIICASGGFAMDDDDDDDIDNDHSSSSSSNIGKVYQKMLQMNYYPVVASGEIAKKHLNKSPKSTPLFLTIGAMAALSPSPNMIAYSTSKQASHYYIQTMGAMCGDDNASASTSNSNSQALSKQYKIQRENEMGKDYRRKNRIVLSKMSCIALLPIMIDTELNRQVLKDKVIDEVEYKSWTKPVDIAKEIGRWVDTPELRPHSGSLVKVVTNNGETAFTLAR